MKIGSDGVQLLGGHGYVKEHPVERWYRDLRAVGLMEGGCSRMSINLEVPKKFEILLDQAHRVAVEVFRPISRKYDLAEHEYPKELDMLAALIDGMNESGQPSAGARGVRRENGSSGQTASATARTCPPCSA